MTVNHHPSKMLAVLAGILFSAGVASANPDDDRDGGTSLAPETEPADAQTTTTGRVIAMTRVETPEMDQPELIVLVREDDGSSTMVDLGPASKVDELDLDLGDTLTATGASETVHGMAFLKADEAKTSDGQVAIEHSEQHGTSDPGVPAPHKGECPDVGV